MAKNSEALVTDGPSGFGYRGDISGLRKEGAGYQEFQDVAKEINQSTLEAGHNT